MVVLWIHVMWSVNRIKNHQKNEIPKTSVYSKVKRKYVSRKYFYRFVAKKNPSNI